MSDTGKAQAIPSPFIIRNVDTLEDERMIHGCPGCGSVGSLRLVEYVIISSETHYQPGTLSTMPLTNHVCLNSACEWVGNISDAMYSIRTRGVLVDDVRSFEKANSDGEQ